VVETSFSIAEFEKSFHENARAAREQLIQFKKADQAAFLRQAIEFLEAGNSNSYSQTVSQLVRENSSNLTQMLQTADLLNLEQAARLLRVSSKNDPAFQTDLIASVKLEIDLNGAGVSRKDLTRLLELLARSVETERLGAMLAKLCDHPDERIRSKVAVLAGSMVRQNPAFASLLKDVDPRVRANAVEALWGKRDEESVELFREAGREAHPRIAANGLYGLYLAGDITCIPNILKLARDGELTRKLAGAWLIGKTSDARFHIIVRESLAVSTGPLRFALLKAGRKIKQRQEQLMAGPRLPLRLIELSRLEAGRVWVCFGADTEDLVATQLVVHDGEMRVDQFHFHRHEAGPLAHVGCCYSANGVGKDIARGMVQAKRADDFWITQAFSGTEAAAEPFVLPGEFLRESEALNTAQLSVATDFTPGFESATTAVVNRLSSCKGSRQLLLVLSGDDLQVIPTESWMELFSQQQVVPFVIAAATLAEPQRKAWQSFCSSRKGLLVEMQSGVSIESVCTKLQQAMSSHCSVGYKLGRMLPSSDALGHVSIEVFQQAAYGRLVVQADGVVVEQSPVIEERLSESIG
jgi:hypothetical protein